MKKIKAAAEKKYEDKQKKKTSEVTVEETESSEVFREMKKLPFTE